jgi:predicted dienelactone hydrolase
MARQLIPALFALVLAAPATAATIDQDWRDAARADRLVPVRLYLPDGAGRHPVVVFSHGLGGSREGAAYLGEAWRRAGYVGVFLQHAGTDRDAVRGGGMAALRRAGADPRAAVDRFRDLPFALDELARRAAGPGPLAGRIDLDRIAVAGHSYGAISAAVGVGRTAAGRSSPDPRLKAAILLSPQTPPSGDPGVAFSPIKVPVLHVTGTRDEGIVGGATPADRQRPFALIPSRPQALVVFRDADHLVFSGWRPGRPEPGDAAIQADVATVTTRFLDAVLRNDAAARAWMFQGGLARALDGRAEVRVKP